MLNAAANMKSIGEPTRDARSQSSIFGSAGGLAQSITAQARFRISVYPIICADMPDAAMGIASCLSYLLEQYRDIKVYRCFAKIDPADEGAEITEADYQFSISDWELEGLDDNIALSGKLEKTDGGFQLRLFMDLSLLDNQETAELVFDFGALYELINSLPRIASTILETLAGSPSHQLVISYPALTADFAETNALLEIVFGWNLDLYLYLWDMDWDEDEILAQFDDIIDTFRSRENGFAFWCLGMMAKQVMQIRLETIGNVIVPLLNQSLDANDQYPHGAAALAMGLSALGYADRAVQLLERYTWTDAADASTWNTLIDVYLGGGQMAEAIDANQRALEKGVEHPALYWRYAQMLMMSETHDWYIEDVLLIDPDEIDEEEQVPCEIINALKRLLALNSENLNALQLALTYMIEVNDEELWEYFARLVQNERAAPYVSNIIERLIDLEDLEPAYEMLQEQINKSPAEPYPCLYLAQLALVDGDSELAKTSIASCRQCLVQPDDDLELELQHLELSAALPGFEQRFAEIKVMLNAKRHVSDRDVEFLEEALEIAPRIIDLYITLSRCYRVWRDLEAALEVLAEAEQAAGEHPRIVQGMVEILWHTNQNDQAIEKLNAALGSFPNDVHLLAQMANYLIDHEQLEDARPYIERAESIAPSHREVWRLRQRIALKLAN